MLERNRRRLTSTRLSQKRCQTTLLLIITGMNLIGVAVLIVLFACHKAQEYRRNPPIFTSTLSFENLTPFPSSHFTRLTSDTTQQLLRTRFFDDNELPRGIWIFGDNLRTAPCCEIETDLTPVYQEFPHPEPSPPSFTPPEPITFEIQPSLYGSNEPLSIISMTIPQTTENDQMNDYFTGFGATITSTEPLFTMKNSQSGGMFMAKLAVEKLFSNQIDGIVGPPSIKPSSSTMDFGLENKNERKLISPPSTVPDAAQLKILNKEIKSTTKNSRITQNKVSSSKTESQEINEIISPNSTLSTKALPNISNVLMPTTSNSQTSATAAIFLECSVEKNQHDTHNCQQWKEAGYCNSHPATKYIFCRRQCLCILP